MIQDHSTKVLAQEFCMYGLIIVTGPCRFVAVRTSPFQTDFICTIPNLYRSKPLFVCSAHALTYAVPYETVSFPH